MYAEYWRSCELGKFQVGDLWLFKSGYKWILNFPTKQDWRRPSMPEYVAAGLEKFVNSFHEQGISSVAFPALGCGNGGLSWTDVAQPLMERYLAPLSFPVII